MDSKDLFPWKSLLWALFTCAVDFLAFCMAVEYAAMAWSRWKTLGTPAFSKSEVVIVLLLILVLCRRLDAAWRAYVARKRMNVVLTDLRHFLALDGQTAKSWETIGELLHRSNQHPELFTQTRRCLQVLETLGFENLLLRDRQGKHVPITSYEWWLVTR